MTDRPEQQADKEPADQTSAGEGRGASRSSVGLLLVGAVFCMAVSLALPDRPPIVRSDSAENWLSFAGTIVRQTLQALSIVAVALALSAFVPRIGLWVEGLVLRSNRRAFLAATAGIAVLTSGCFAYFVLDHMPHVPDELAMLFQARIMSSGRLYAPAPALPEFFDYEHLVVDGPRWYGKYFPAQSLPLALGLWVGAPWLINPILAGVAVWLTYLLGRELSNERAARVAAILMVVSPFRSTLFGMMLSHASCLVMLAVFALGMIKVVKDPRRTGWALAAGLALGFAADSRPLTALAMAAVIGVAGLWMMPWQRCTWRTVMAFMVPLMLMGGVLLGYNQVLTGTPTTTPFTKWSPKDRLGFGSDVGLEYWREADRGHTLRKGLLKDTYFNLEALGLNLTGWGHCTLLLLAWAVIRGPWPKQAWLLAAVSAGLMVAYVFHSTHSVMAGQARYWSEAMPMMMLLVCMGLVILRRWLPIACRWLGLLPAVRTGRSACWLAGAMLTAWSVPLAQRAIIDDCRGDFWGQKPAIRDLAAREKLSNALVFVKAAYYRDRFHGGPADMYPSAFMLNDPDLKGPVVYARDLGDQRNAALIAGYPGRAVYRLDPSQGAEMRFTPVPLPPTTRAGP